MTLLIVNSMPKCASTWFHNLVVRSLSQLGHPAPHESVQGYPVRLNAWANPGDLAGENLAGLLAAARTNTYAIKAHRPPNPELLEVLAKRQAQTVFLIRHPESIVRSTLAFGEHCRAHPELEPDSPYAQIFEPQQAAEFVAPFVDWGRGWLAERPQDVIRFETMLATDAAIVQAVSQLYRNCATVADSVLEEMRPERLSTNERNRYRINLVRRPELTPLITQQCAEWAGMLGYAATG